MRTLLYVITEDWFFCSHFLARARAAVRAGFRVLVATRVNVHGDAIAAQGIDLIALDIARSGMRPWRELHTLWALLLIYWRYRPDIVHHIAVKPILYGSLVAKVLSIPYIVNAPVGMGYVFSSSHWRARLLRPLISLAYRVLMNPPNSRVVLENPDDLAALIEQGIVCGERSRLIKGAGVDTELFCPGPKPLGSPIVAFPARMLIDKGLMEFVDAARRLKADGVEARFVLVGAPDSDNPASIRNEQLSAWQAEGTVEWWGYRADMADVFRQVHIVCLPSYREGLPKALIEAAACGLPIITTDVPGCREVVVNGENGFLVRPRSVEALLSPLRKLIESPSLREQFGRHGRNKAVGEFAEARVIADTLELYRGLVTASDRP